MEMSELALLVTFTFWFRALANAPLPKFRALSSNVRSAGWLPVAFKGMDVDPLEAVRQGERAGVALGHTSGWKLTTTAHALARIQSKRQ